LAVLKALSFFKGFVVLILKNFEGNSRDINFKDQQLTKTKSLQLKSTKIGHQKIILWKNLK
jgi:hypothetical protein